jgi:uncharacterized iron-regulated protein
MKYQLAIASFAIWSLSVLSLPAQNPADQPPAVTRIENSRTGETLTLADLLDSLSRSDVVFLGEQHDNDSGHTFQFDVIKGLVEQGHSIAISTEQFERDVQGALDDFLSGRLDEEAFLKAARPWKNYAEHYRPIIEFAKENKLPVIAGNVPRRIASTVSSGKQPATEDHPFLPRNTTTTKNAYWEKFQATMQGHMGADGETKMEQFFASQCLKDDAMAEAITDFIAINAHQPRIVIHLCGHFHSDYGLGTVSRVIQRRPLTRVSVVTMESLEKNDSQTEESNLRDRAHFTFWTIKNSKPETKE